VKKFEVVDRTGKLHNVEANYFQVSETGVVFHSSNNNEDTRCHYFSYPCHVIQITHSE
jgi:hypothetical protein